MSLDVGTGLPALAGTHEVAQQAAPDCAVVYADNDPWSWSTPGPCSPADRPGRPLRGNGAP